MFYNYFNKLVTGLVDNRLVYEKAPDAPKPMKEGVVSKPEMEEELEKYSKGEVVARVNETQEEYLARIEKMKQDDKKKLEELAEKNTREANAKYGKDIESVKVETPFGPISVQRDAYPVWEGKTKVVPGLRTEEVAQAKPEPTPAELAKKEADSKMAREKAEEELTALLGEKPGKKPAPEYRPAEALAMAGEAATEGGIGRVAYIAEQLDKRNADIVRTWVAYTKRFAEELVKNPSASIDDVVVTLKKDTNLKANEIELMGNLVKNIKDIPMGTEKEVASVLLEALKSQTKDERVKKGLDFQLNLIYG